jgi:L-rhamnose mutarotase
MEFKEALKKLGIEDYAERIFNSNSHGELFHVYDYIVLAENIKDTSWFREWFEAVIDYANKNWERPQSIYQHVMKMLQETIN